MIIQTLIDAAYRKNSINTPDNTQRTAALLLLNSMLSSWDAESLSIPYNVREALSLTSGSGIYTIGSGGDLDTARPIKIINAFIRDANSVDYEIDIGMNRWEYDAISDKTATGRPARLYYDPQYPLGILYFDSVTANTETLYLTSEKHVTSFATVDDTITTLPTYYEEAIVYNLAVRIATEEDTKISPVVLALAVSSKSTLENLHSQDKLIKHAFFDSMLTYETYK